MRNTKKLIAVLLTVAMLAMSMVPALAASYTTEADALMAAGLMKGTGAGAADLDVALDRVQGITLVIRAMGKEAAAMAMTEAEITAALATVEDAAELAAWARPYAAYAVANGITNGVGGAAAGMIKFAATAPLSGTQFITMMVRALGYTGVTLANCIDKAMAAGMLTASQAVAVGGKAQLLRDDAALVMFASVKGGMMASATGVTPGAMKLVDSLVAGGAITSAAALAFGYVAPTPTPAPAVTVVSASTTNLVEVLVVFNTAVDEDEAEDETNYTIDGATIDAAAVQADGKSVILTIDGATNLTLDAEYTLTVSSDVAAVETDIDFVAADNAVPVLESIALTGPDSFDLVFSEPIDSASVATMVIDVADGVYSGTATGDDSNTVSVSLGVSSLEAGNYDVEVSGAQDFAGYTAVKKTLTLVYVVDTTAPTATVTSADQTEVVITFNEDVEDEDGNELDQTFFWHSNKLYMPVAETYDPGDEYTLDFSNNPLPEGNVRIVVDYNGTDDDVAIQDLWGNALTGDLVFNVTITADTTKPTATVAVDDEYTVVVTFSEGVLEADAEDLDNFVVKQDGDVVDADSATYDSDDNTTTLAFTDALDGAYTITISDVSDDSINENTINAITLPFTVTDSTGMDLSVITAEGIDDDGGKDYIIVRFPDDVATTGVYSALNKDNYQIDFNDTNGYVDLDSADTIALFGTDAVKITIVDETRTAVGANVMIGRIADSQGNVSALLSYSPIVVAAVSAPAVDEIWLTSYKTLDVVFDTTVVSAPVTGFMVVDSTGAAANPAGVTLATDDGITTATLTLKAGQQLTSDEYTDFTDGTIYVGLVASKIKSDTGEYAVALDVTDAGERITVVDNIAPMIDDVDQTDVDTIEVTMTEDVELINNTLAATDFVIKDADNDELTAGTDYTVALAAGAADGADADALLESDVVVITLIGDYAGYEDDLSVDTIASPKYIQDADGNSDLLANNGDAFEFTADATAVTLSVPAATNATTNDANSLVITFTEALYDATTHVALVDDEDFTAYIDDTNLATGVIGTAKYDADTYKVTIVFSIDADDGDNFDVVLTDLEDAAGIDGASDVTITYTAATTLWAD